MYFMYHKNPAWDYNIVQYVFFKNNALYILSLASMKNA